MHLAAEIISDRLPMTPDRSVQWLAYEMPALDSALYVDPSYASGPASLLVEKMVRVAQFGPQSEPDVVKLLQGKTGVAYRLNDVVIKRSHKRNAIDEACGLSATQALLTLHEGLRRLGKRRFEAVAPYACLVAGRNAPAHVRTTSLMSYAEGETPFSAMIGLPDEGKRRKVYNAAIALCGADDKDIYYDDSACNFKVQRCLRIVHTITKFDVWSQPEFVKKMSDNPPPPFTDY